MNIAAIKVLDDGIGGVQLQAQIKFVQDAKNITGTSAKGPYDFWAQFIVLEDGSGSIGVSITMTDPQFAYTVQDKGKLVTVKGTVASYVKDGQTIKKLDRAKLVEAHKQQPSQAPPAENTYHAPAQRDYDKENRGKCRFGMYQACLQAGLDPTDLSRDWPVLDAIEVLVGYSMNGLPAHDEHGVLPGFVANQPPRVNEGDLGQTDPNAEIPYQ